MSNEDQPVPVSQTQIERVMRLIRGQWVVLDADLAKLLGMPMTTLNWAIKRNAEAFPRDFVFRLTHEEAAETHPPARESGSGCKPRRRPRAFTELGVAMLPLVLCSETAIQVNIEIIRVFVRLREQPVSLSGLATQVARLAKTVQLHDDQIKDVTEALRKLAEGPHRRTSHQPPEPSLN